MWQLVNDLNDVPTKETTDPKYTKNHSEQVPTTAKQERAAFNQLVRFQSSARYGHSARKARAVQISSSHYKNLACVGAD